jgi:hypothetical protein
MYAAPLRATSQTEPVDPAYEKNIDAGRLTAHDMEPPAISGWPRHRPQGEGCRMNKLDRPESVLRP